MSRLPDRVERGFALVGVVMFVLVLTILGLSLFSLSGFEAQFFYRSQDEGQAFWNAVGGIERAKFMLTHHDSLQSVWVQPGSYGGVIYARAMQKGDSSGAVDWGGTERVTIRVVGVQGDGRRMLESSFIPSRPGNVYKHLISTFGTTRSNRITVIPGGPGLSEVWLTGEVWQNTTDVAWTGCGPPLPGSHPTSIGGVPDPDLDSFFSIHVAGATDVPYTSAGDYDFPSGGYYKTTGRMTNGWSLYQNTGSPSINVHNNTVIWMFEHGAHFETGPDPVEIIGGGPNAALVLVAKSNELAPLEPETGFSFQSGTPTWPILSAVPVFIVTDGQVWLEQIGNNTDNTSIGYISIYAQNFVMQGPNPGHLMSLAHPISATQDVPSGLVDFLYDQGFLPNTTAGLRASLAPVSGSWSEITASNPPLF